MPIRVCSALTTIQRGTNSGSPLPGGRVRFLTVTVTFHDRSSRQYKLTKHSGGNYLPVPNTARDSSHNLLPETPPTGYQNYSFYDNPHGYNPTNMILLLQPPALPGAQGGCETIHWDGVGVTCVHPY